MDPPDLKKKTIWVDLDNSPHVPLFAPLIKHYRESGVEVILTARDHSQTLELLELQGLTGTFEVIGRHYGKSKLQKIRGLFARAKQLVSYIKTVHRSGTNIPVAVSHGSRSMVLAAKWLRIPVITMYDYEFTETTIFNKFSDKVLVPERIPDSVLDGIGLSSSKRVKYPGIKEELYVRNFQPNRDLRSEYVRLFGDDPSKWTTVVLRPPASTANYHSEMSDNLFLELLRRLVTSPKVFTFIVPRTKEQGEMIRKTIIDVNSWASALILENAIDGLDLVFFADLLISGGGTMNREAALLGIPVYSIFAGRQGALDAQMEKEGLITFIRTEEDIAKISLVRRNRDESAVVSNVLTDKVERFVIEQINSFLK